jgi:general secretion pathway protein D
MGGGRVGMQGGTAPSYGSPGASGTKANPSGIFPGPSGLDPVTGQPILSPGVIPPSGSDNLLTGGLRNAGSAPALATISGILTDPQFRVVIRALEQRQGVDLLSSPKVTTVSSRQAQIKIVDVRYIVTELDTDQTSAGGGVSQLGGTSGGGGVGSLIQPIAEPYELGPVLDVVPYVSADGYTIQMTIIPTIKEFIGYDLENARLFSAQVQSVGSGGGTGGVGNPLTQITPLPIFRLRQVVTSAIVWDGQTVVLGGLMSENVTKTKDKIPVLGDIPVVGRLFRSEASQTRKKNLVIFVTPTIIDPAGNRVHSDEDLPFAQSNVPVQKPLEQAQAQPPAEAPAQ